MKGKARKIPELLVPAGGPEQLKAAAANGADAVYMSGRSFNARISAENFSDEELERAVDFLHTYGVDAHIAMNILLRKEELDPAVSFARRMYRAGADALIVQDPGLIARLREACPDLPLHMSTQGTIYDEDGARAAQMLGMKRVITARELSLKEIRRICQSVDIEVEVFVHGAICIGYSGQCHLSGTIGGRSGNRGACAQPCRLPYELRGEKSGTAAGGFLLSPKDMSLLDHLRELSAAGVASLKIEGRMKSPEYVALTTSVYRRYLDRIRDGREDPSRSEYAADTAKMRQVFARGAFTDGYLAGDSGAGLMAAETSKHTGVRIGKLVRTDPKRGRAAVRLTAPLRNGDGVEIRDGERACGNIITYIRGKNGQLVRQAEAGMSVTIGDLDPRLLRGLGEGAPLFRITDAALMKNLRRSYEKMPARVPVDIHLTAVTGSPAVLTAVSVDGGRRHVVSVETESPLERSESRPPEEDRIRASLEKTGGTPYFPRRVDMVIRDDPFLSSSELNALRRNALDALTEKRTASRRPDGAQASEFKKNKHPEPRRPEKMPDAERSDPCPSAEPAENRPEKTVVLYFYNTDQAGQRVRELSDLLRETGLGAELAVPCEWLVQETPGRALQPSALADYLKKTGLRVYAVLPAVTRGFSESEKAELAGLLERMCCGEMVAGVYAANLSHICALRKKRIPFLADVSMNILNPESARAAGLLGASGAVLSSEPDALEAWPSCGDGTGTPGEPVPLEVLGYGRTPAMYMAHCPVGGPGVTAPDHRGPDCSPERKHYYCRKDQWVLRDRRGESFPLLPDSRDCSAVLYSHRCVDRTGIIDEITSAGISRIRICVFNENAKEILEKIKIISYVGDIIR